MRQAWRIAVEVGQGWGCEVALRMREWSGDRPVHAPRPGTFVIADFSDPTNERIILLSAAGLVVVGVALLVGTILWWRRGRQEHPALAPLEVLGSRRWAKAPEGDRQRRLARVRVAGHQPGPDEPVRSEPVDLQALVRSVPQAFDDLREPGVSLDDDWFSWVAAEPKGDVAAVGELLPVDEPALVEAESASPNGTLAPDVEVDPDATSYSAERPSATPDAPAVGGKAPLATGNGSDDEALASHGDQPQSSVT